MSRFLAVSLGLALAAAAYPGLAAPPVEQPMAQSTEPATAVSAATAAALAKVVAPAELMIPLEIDQARKAILALPTLDADAKALEQEFPGLYAAVWTAVEPELRRSTAADHPAFQSELEKVYRARLTEREAQAVMTFFRSATGQKLIRGMYGNIDASHLLAEMASSDSGAIDAKQMKAVTDAAKAKAVQQIGPEDEASLMALVASIDLRKFQALGAETQKVTLDWVNKEDPEGENRLGQIMEDAMEQYMAAHPSKK